MIEDEALHDVVARLPKTAQLLLVFNAFGDRLAAEHRHEIGDGLDDQMFSSVVAGVDEEAPVELDEVCVGCGILLRRTSSTLDVKTE